MEPDEDEGDVRWPSRRSPVSTVAPRGGATADRVVSGMDATDTTMVARFVSTECALRAEDLGTTTPTGTVVPGDHSCRFKLVLNRHGLLCFINLDGIQILSRVNIHSVMEANYQLVYQNWYNSG